VIRPLWIALFLIVCYLIVGTIDYAAAKVSHLILLDISSQPATLDECQRAAPGRGRPVHVVSFQNGSDAPWHHRRCTYQ